MNVPNYSDEPTAPLVVFTPTAPPSIYEDSSSGPPPPRQEWACPQCTLLNSVHANICGACSFIKEKYEGTTEKTPTNILVPSESFPEPVKTYFDSKPEYRATPDSAHNSDNEGSVSVEEIPGEDQSSKKRRRRRRRRYRVAAGATAGVIVGAIVGCGPWGAIVGGVAGGVGARVLSKRGERKKDIRMAQSQLSRAVVD